MVPGTINALFGNSYFMQMIQLKESFKLSKSGLYEMKFVFSKQATWLGGLHSCVELYQDHLVIMHKKFPINQMLTFPDNLGMCQISR